MSKKIKGPKPAQPGSGYEEKALTVRLSSGERYDWNMVARAQGKSTNSFILSAVRAVVTAHKNDVNNQHHTEQEPLRCDENAQAAAG